MRGRALEAWQRSGVGSSGGGQKEKVVEMGLRRFSRRTLRRTEGMHGVGKTNCRLIRGFNQVVFSAFAGARMQFPHVVAVWSKAWVRSMCGYRLTSGFPKKARNDAPDRTRNSSLRANS
jgi:hypothetical protein